MKNTVNKIDKALKDLYQIDIPVSANDYILNLHGVDEKLLPHGTLFVQEEKEDLSVGIYFHPTIRNFLSACESRKKIQWTSQETNAFATATEEISHFLYLIYHANEGRSVSQFDLELQGEIDKFLLLFFQDERDSKEEAFENLYETVFQNFKWHPLVTEEQQKRYEDANLYAKKFALLTKDNLCQKKNFPELLKVLRDYYRLSSADKISFLHKD